MDSAEGVVQHLAYNATFPLLLNISSQPTYFMSLKDSAQLVKMYAMVNVRQYTVVATGTTVAECEQNYINLLVSNGIVSGGEVVTNGKLGTITDMRTAVIDGNTTVYIKLDNNSFYYSIPASEAQAAVLLNVGDYVEVLASEGEGDIIPAHGVRRASRDGQQSPAEPGGTDTPTE